MANNDADHALVVGIDRYRWDDLASLGGALADANDFVAWLVDQRAAGGGLDATNVTLIEGNDPPSAPTALLIGEAFSKLVARAKPGTRKIGRRLYVFMSGHGASHEAHGVNNVGLLPATFDDDDENFYVVGQLYVETLQKRAAFEEILLFMDCCRDLAPMPLTIMPPGFSGTVQEGSKPAATLIAYATQYGAKARERDFTVGGAARRRGVFTTALLEALHGWAVDPDTGAVTKDSLERYLNSRISYYRPKGSQQTPQVDGHIDMVIVPGPIPARKTKLVIEFSGTPPDRVIVKTGASGEETAVVVPAGATEVAVELEGLRRWLVWRPNGVKSAVNVAGEEMRFALP